MRLTDQRTVYSLTYLDLIRRPGHSSGGNVQAITWPSGLERPAVTASTSCRVRPLPDTIRPCRPDTPTVDRAEHAVFPVHHLAGCCVVGALAWVGLITASRAVLNVVVQFV